MNYFFNQFFKGKIRKQTYEKIKLEIERITAITESEMWLLELEDLKKKIKLI